MPGFSDTQEQNVLEAYFQNAALTTYSPMYIALCTAAPVDSSNTIAEVSYTGDAGNYARQPISNLEWSTTVGDPSYSANTVEVTFPTSNQAGGTATHFALMSALTVGLLLFSGQIVQPPGGLVISSGVQPKIDIGALRCQLGN